MLKDEILKALAANRGSSISGQSLAARFGVSRNAVWKAVKTLEAEGIALRARTNKGYALAPDALTPYDVTPPQGTEVFFYNSIDSTNTEAKRLLAGGLSTDAMVIANEQTAGRGRLGRSFYSPKDTGIYFSYIFHPQKSLADAVFITTAAAVSVVRAIESISPLRPQIKWVNDVYIGDKKVCGILTEAVSDFESGALESVIVGIGVNVSTVDFPPEVAPVARALNCAQITRPALLQALTQELISAARDLQNPAILADYRAHSLVLGKDITFIKNGVSYAAKVLEIDDTGALKVQTAAGIERLHSGEISIKLRGNR